jgi:hypothetical protein
MGENSPNLVTLRLRPGANPTNFEFTNAKFVLETRYAIRCDVNFYRTVVTTLL